MKFLFDTADEAYISEAWSTFNKFILSDSVAGITTNPNALSKIKCNSLSELEIVIPRLCQLVTSIRRNRIGGTVHVQIPRSIMNKEDILHWAWHVMSFSDGYTTVAVKIPFFNYALEIARTNPHIIWNVTGISDWATILKAASGGTVSYVSLIPGRMEEAGIDANAHMEFLMFSCYLHNARVITGSMRTIEGLKNAIKYNTLPTIGQRVWDEIRKNNMWQEVASMWDESYMDFDLSFDELLYGPTVTQTSRDLSKAFFEQMDTLGTPIFEEFMKMRQV